MSSPLLGQAGPPTKIIIALSLGFLVLFGVVFIVLNQSGGAQSSADVQRIFASSCNSYIAQGCDWELTKSSSFPSFLQACRTLHGEERQEYSCLYQLCCQSSTDITTDGLCDTCTALKQAGVDNAACCQSYSERSQRICSACIR